MSSEHGQLELVDHHLGGVAFLERLVSGEPLWVAAEDDVDATAGHVRGDGDGVQAAGLGDDCCLLGVLLGVEHGVRDAQLVEPT